MYLKRNRKKSCGVSYDYWTLVESVRTASGQRQRVVANIGKLFWEDDSGRKLFNEMKEVRSMDVLLDVKDRNPARLRVVGRPEKHLSELLDTLGIKLPNRPKNIKM